MLSYAIICIIVYSGLWIGYLLSIISPEEMQPGRKYFLIIRNCLLLLSLGVVSIVNIPLAVISAIATLAFGHLYTIEKIMPLIYLFLGFALFLGYSMPGIFIIESAVFFLLGFPMGSTSKKKYLAGSLSFFLAALLPLFIAQL